MQADSLEAFISSHECLASQRGKIMTRNSCRTPWTKFMNVSARQSLPSLHGQNFILQLDIFNFLNLLNKNWGAQDLGSSNSPSLAYPPQRSRGTGPAAQVGERSAVGVYLQLRTAVQYQEPAIELRAPAPAEVRLLSS